MSKTKILPTGNLNKENKSFKLSSLTGCCEHNIVIAAHCAVEHVYFFKTINYSNQ